MAVIGIDEAGRGPVLGSLFVAGVRLPETHTIHNTVKDSKQSTTNQINTIAQTLYDDDTIQTIVIEITAQQITACENLTELTAQTMNTIAERLYTTGDTVIADACHPTIDTFKSSFTLPDDAHFIAEHKADENHSAVSAAGCLAKYNREAHIEHLTTKYPNYTIGSGYPSHTTTRDFLKQYHRDYGSFPHETRLSWNTCDKLRQEVENKN